MVDLNEQERGDLAMVAIKVMDSWGLEAEEQIILLGLPEKTRKRELNRYRHGSALPQEMAIIDRCRHILRIHHALELMFPLNPALSNAWVTDPGNRSFGKAPAAVMLDEGMEGIRRVCGILENEAEW